MELHTKELLLDLSLFANPRFIAAAAITVIFDAGIFGSTYLMPMFTQTVQHFSVTQNLNNPVTLELLQHVGDLYHWAGLPMDQAGVMERVFLGI